MSGWRSRCRWRARPGSCRQTSDQPSAIVSSNRQSERRWLSSTTGREVPYHRPSAQETDFRPHTCSFATCMQEQPPTNAADVSLCLGPPHGTQGAILAPQRSALCQDLPFEHIRSMLLAGHGAEMLSSRVHSLQAHDRKPAAIKRPARADGAPKAQAQTGAETPGPPRTAAGTSSSEEASRTDTSSGTSTIHQADKQLVRALANPHGNLARPPPPPFQQQPLPSGSSQRAPYPRGLRARKRGEMPSLVRGWQAAGLRHKQYVPDPRSAVSSGR